MIEGVGFGLLPFIILFCNTRGVILKAVFDFGIHDSKIVEIFYNENLQPVVVPPNCVIDLSTIRSFYRNNFTSIPDFLSFAKKQWEGSFYLRRSYALGDLLMLVPVIRHLRTLGHNPYIKTTDLFVDVLNALGISVSVIRNRLDTEEFGISLDGTIERDHWEQSLNQIHRIHIYLKSLGIKKIPKELDWSYDPLRFPEMEVDDDPFVLLQDGGSTRMKKLVGNTDYIIKKFGSVGIKVIPISDLFGKHLKSASHLFSLMAKAKCLITMDSGPLWISHFTKTPVVCIFGPTRPKERLTLHPLYPEGAVGVELSKEVNCKPCFEHAVKCDNKVSCLAVPIERIYELLEPKVFQFLEKE